MASSSEPIDTSLPEWEATEEISTTTASIATSESETVFWEDNAAASETTTAVVATEEALPSWEETSAPAEQEPVWDGSQEAGNESSQPVWESSQQAGNDSQPVWEDSSSSEGTPSWVNEDERSSLHRGLEQYSLALSIINITTSVLAIFLPAVWALAKCAGKADFSIPQAKKSTPTKHFVGYFAGLFVASSVLNVADIAHDHANEKVLVVRTLALPMVGLLGFITMRTFSKGATMKTLVAAGPVVLALTFAEIVMVRSIHRHNSAITTIAGVAIPAAALLGGFLLKNVMTHNETSFAFFSCIVSWSGVALIIGLFHYSALYVSAPIGLGIVVAVLLMSLFVTRRRVNENAAVIAAADATESSALEEANGVPPMYRKMMTAEAPSGRELAANPSACQMKALAGLNHA